MGKIKVLYRKGFKKSKPKPKPKAKTEAKD
jgi:hypothetical protein